MVRKGNHIIIILNFKWLPDWMGKKTTQLQANAIKMMQKSSIQQFEKTKSGKYYKKTCMALSISTT